MQETVIVGDIGTERSSSFMMWDQTMCRVIGWVGGRGESAADMRLFFL